MAEAQREEGNGRVQDRDWRRKAGRKEGRFGPGIHWEMGVCAVGCGLRFVDD